MKFEIHPIVKKFIPRLQFTEVCYDGKRRWFEESVNIEELEQGYLINNSSSLSESSCHVNWQLANLFLPIEESETSNKNKGRYFSRLRRSRWKPLFKTTINNFVGLLSRYTLSQQLEKIEELNDIDLQGKGHYSFFQECDRLALRDGWCAVWCDYAETRPFLKIIERRQIIDYEIDDNKLTKLVIKEMVYQGHELVEKIKVIEPSLMKEYIKNKSEYDFLEEYPYDLSYIPIVFYPINTINPFKEGLPLLEVAEDNRTHYQIASDYRESLHYKSLPLFVRIGLIEIGGDQVGLTPLELTPHSVADVPLQGDIKVVETTGQAINLNKDALKEIEQEIMEKTLNFLGDNTNMTATEANFRANQQKASYEIYINQKMSAIQEIFVIWFEWENMILEEDAISMDTSFLETLSPEFIRELKEMVTLNYLDLETFWQILKSAGALPKNINIMDVIARVRGQSQLDLIENGQR